MKLINRISKYNSEIKKLSPHGLLFSYLDLFLSALLCGASFNDYIRYRFWEKTWSLRKTFITYKKNKRLIKKYNDPNKIELLENKAVFNDYFKKYIKRDWLLIEEDNYQEFLSFASIHSSFIGKPVRGGQGRNIELFSDIKDKKAFFEEHEEYLLEEVIDQNNQMNLLNPGSVNSVRVLTINKNNSIRIIAASLKTGGSNGITDNLSSGGIAASIDIETGIVFTEGMDYSYQYYIKHPVSNLVIPGFQIPHWDKVKQIAIECAEQIPEIGYIGWDVAVLENDCLIIEGNHDPGHGIVQMIDQIGKYYQIINDELMVV